MPKFSLIIFSSALLFACASNEKTAPEQCSVKTLSTNFSNSKGESYCSKKLSEEWLAQQATNPTLKQVRQKISKMRNHE